MPNSNDPLFHVDKLNCERGERLLFSELSFSLSNGALLQVVGSNGSGKTSLLRILSGLSHPTAGHVYWEGKSISESRADYLSQMIFIGHQSGLKANLSPIENMRLIQSHFQNHSTTEYLSAFQKTGLNKIHINEPTFTLSVGQKRRAALARLSLTQARLWILDEPFAGLDNEGVDSIRGMLSEHISKGGLVVMSSHQTMDFKFGNTEQINL